MAICEFFDENWTLQDGTGCWIWRRAKNKRGYGKLVVCGKLISAHRFSYERANGAITSGEHVLHRCDNPSCVNPGHLFLGDHADNMVDMTSKGRSGKAKHSPADVANARRLYDEGHTRSEVSRITGISYTNLCYILRGKTWTGVAA
jgi:hypothetical protein